MAFEDNETYSQGILYSATEIKLLRLKNPPS